MKDDFKIKLTYKLNPNDLVRMSKLDLSSSTADDFYYALFDGNVDFSIGDTDFGKYLCNIRVFAFASDLYVFTQEMMEGREDLLILPIFTAPLGVVFRYHQETTDVEIYLDKDALGGKAGRLSRALTDKEKKEKRRFMLSPLRFRVTATVSLQALSDASKKFACQFLSDVLVQLPSLIENQLIWTKFFPGLTYQQIVQFGHSKY